MHATRASSGSGRVARREREERRPCGERRGKQAKGEKRREGRREDTRRQGWDKPVGAHRKAKEEENSPLEQRVHGVTQLFLSEGVRSAREGGRKEV